MLQKIRVGRLLLGFGLAWFCLLLWPAPAWAEDGSAAYVQRDGGRIYTVINTVRVETAAPGSSETSILRCRWPLTKACIGRMCWERNFFLSRKALIRQPMAAARLII